MSFCIAPGDAALAVAARTEDGSLRMCCRMVLVPWEFVRFNLFRGGSAAYGTHPWHWNFTAGFPAVLATLLPLLFCGIAWSGRTR